MQAAWSQMSGQLEKQKQLTNEIIMEMTQEKYRRKFSKFQIYEGLGALICFIFTIYLILNLHKLDTWYLLTFGIIILAYFAIIPALVLNSIQRMKKINIMTNSYKETLVEFTKKKNHLLFIQRLGITLNFIVVIAMLPVIAKIGSNKDIFIEVDNIWYIYSLVMIVFLVLASRWGYKCYKSAMTSTEHLIKDINNTNNL